MFTLALALGRTVGEIEGMSGSEFSEWVQFYQIQPFGPVRDNIHAALIASTMANALRGSNARPMPWQDWMLGDPEEKRRRKTQEMISWLTSVAKPRDN